MFFVAEVLRHRQPGKRDAQPRARRLVHLAVDERNLRRAQVLLIDDARLRHLVIEVVPFPRTLADTGEHRNAAVELRDVVDQLHDDDRLPHPRSAERADLAALEKWTDEINHFDSCRQQRRRSRLLRQPRRRPVNRHVVLGIHRTALVDGAAGHVEHASHHTRTDGNMNRSATVMYAVAAFEALGPRHRNRAHATVAQMLLHLERDADRTVLYSALDRERVVNRRQRARELDVHDRTDDGNNGARVHAAVPPAISSSSCVMRPWRSLLYSSVRLRIMSAALSVAFCIDTIRALCSLAFALSSTTWMNTLM